MGYPAAFPGMVFFPFKSELVDSSAEWGLCFSKNNF